jgi:hypothetical protein
MKLFLGLVLWLMLLMLSPFVAIAALILFPIVWLLALPFRLIGLVVEATFQLLRGVLLLPARLLRVRATA